MKIVINTAGYGVGQGWACQITTPEGKFLYVGIASIPSDAAKNVPGWKAETVQYYGACVDLNINDRAHSGLPIQIGERSVADFLSQIATKEEFDTELSRLLTESGKLSK